MQGQKEFQNRVYQCLLHENQYLGVASEIVGLVTDSGKDEFYVRTLVDTVKKVIKDTKIESKQKFLSLLLLKQCMDSESIQIQNYLKSKILRRLKVLAEFRSNVHQKQGDGDGDKVEMDGCFDERGKYIFGPQVDKEYSQAFYDLNHECIRNWGLQCRYLNEFYSVFQQIQKNKVEIKDKLFFFKEYRKEMDDRRYLQRLKDSGKFKDRIELLMIQIQYEQRKRKENYTNSIFELGNKSGNKGLDRQIQSVFRIGEQQSRSVDKGQDNISVQEQLVKLGQVYRQRLNRFEEQGMVKIEELDGKLIGLRQKFNGLYNRIFYMEMRQRQQKSRVGGYDDGFNRDHFQEQIEQLLECNKQLQEQIQSQISENRHLSRNVDEIGLINQKLKKQVEQLDRQVIVLKQKENEQYIRIKKYEEQVEQTKQIMKQQQEQIQMQLHNQEETERLLGLSSCKNSRLVLQMEQMRDKWRIDS